MGHPDVEWIVDAMLYELRKDYPDLKGLAWYEQDSEPENGLYEEPDPEKVEIRFEKTFDEVPYEFGKNSEHKREGFKHWEDVKATIKELPWYRGFQPTGRNIIKTPKDEHYDWEYPDME